MHVCLCHSFHWRTSWCGSQDYQNKIHLCQGRFLVFLAFTTFIMSTPIQNLAAGRTHIGTWQLCCWLEPAPWGIPTSRVTVHIPATVHCWLGRSDFFCASSCTKMFGSTQGACSSVSLVFSLHRPVSCVAQNMIYPKFYTGLWSLIKGFPWRQCDERSNWCHTFFSNLTCVFAWLLTSCSCNFFRLWWTLGLVSLLAS